MKKAQIIILVLTPIALFSVSIISAFMGRNCDIIPWVMTYTLNYFIVILLLNVIFIVYASLKLKKVGDEKKGELRKVIYLGILSIILAILLIPLYTFLPSSCNVNS